MNRNVPNPKYNLPRPEKLLVLAAFLLLCVMNFQAIANGGKKILEASGTIIVGCILAYMLNIPTDFFERKLFGKMSNPKLEGIKRPVCFVLSVIVSIAVVAVIMGMVIPQIIESGRLLVNELPKLYTNGWVFFEQLTKDYPTIQKDIQGMLPDTNTMVSNITKTLTSWAGGAVNIVKGFFGSIVSIIVGFIFSIYLVLGKKTLKSQFDRVFNWMLGTERKERMYSVLRVANESFHAFFVGQVSEAFIVGILCLVGMTVLKLPYAPMVSSFVGLTALIPMVGAYVGAAFGVVMIATQSVSKALVFLVFIILMQQFEGNVIYPKVVGDKIGLPGLWVLAAVMIGSSLFGIVGTFLGVPLTATVYKLIARRTAAEEKKFKAE